MAQYNIEEWNFSGDKRMDNTIAASAISNQSSSYPEIPKGVVRLTSTSHGYKASPDTYGPRPGNLIYVNGTIYYDGLRKIVAVATNTLDIIAPYVAFTPAGTETLRPSVSFAHRTEIIGIDLHLNTPSGTTENLVMAVTAKRGSAWDRTFLTAAMYGIKDLSKNFEQDKDVNNIIEAGDVLYFTWANTNNCLWGLKILTRRV